MNENLLQAIDKSYQNFLNPESDYGERSNKKIIPIHSFIAKTLSEKLGEEFKINSLGFGNNKEKKVNGQYYDKNVDICISYKDIDISGISVKFITGNYKQNSNNFFENLLGETANIRRKNFKYANFMIMPEYLPYWTNSPTKLTKIEEIDENNLKKYLKLFIDNENCLYHKPDMTFIKLIDTNTRNILEKNLYKNINKHDFKEILLKNYKISYSDLEKNTLFSKEMKDFLEKVGDFEKFIEAFCNLTKSCIYGIK